MHTAAIMGNLWQEHRFSTHDVPGGLGIAQWTLSRREALMQLANYDSLDVQLKYLVHELDTTQNAAKQEIMSATNLVDATVAFQDRFERCDPQYCMQSKRIEYAQTFLDRYT